MADKVLFYYFGDDEAYFKTLQGEFKKNTRLPIDFKRFYESDEKKIQSLFLMVYKHKPKCIFIDFSKKPQDYLHLARIISRTPFEHKMATVGLVDYLSPPEILTEGIATGVNLTHIKSAESFDVVFDVTKLVAPQEMGEHGFATATLKEEVQAGFPCKIGYIQADGLHLETDYKVSKGDRLRLNHHWSAQKVVPSKEVFVKDVSTTNLFYNFSYGVDLEFVFIDEFLPPEGMEDDRIQERKQERDELIVHHRKLLGKWLDDNLSRSQEKKAKVLIVDHEFHFYQEQQRTDKHAYTIRCLPFLSDPAAELGKLQPQVIAFAFDKEGTTGIKNDNEALVKLVDAIKAHFTELHPFLVIFNSPTPSKEMQENLGYEHTMSTSSQLSVDILMRMADIFEKKMLNQQPIAAAKKSKVPEVVFMKKTNTASMGEILIPIQIIKLSETDMIVQAENPLPIGCNLHLTTPVEMYIHIQPTKTQGKTPDYHGLIHCLGEDQKKELRRYVNSIFFREHDAKLQAETDAYKKLNETKAQKIEEEKKKKEDAEAAAIAAQESTDLAAEKPAEETDKTEKT